MNRQQYSVGKKILYLLLGLLAMPAAIGIQLIISIPVIVSLLAQSVMLGAGTIDEMVGRFYELMFSGYYSDMISLVYSVAVVVIFGIWFFFVFRRDHGPFIKGRHVSIGAILGLILLMAALQFFCDIIITGTEAVFPGALNQYEQLMEMAGFEQPTIGAYIYGIIIGPIAEELIFRGIALHYFKRSMPFFLANILQAVLFGIYHMNLIQGVYACVIGLFMGAVISTGRSIFYTIFAHISFNAFGFSEILTYGSDTRLYYYMWIPVMVLLFVLSLILFFEKLNKENCKEYS